MHGARWREQVIEIERHRLFESRWCGLSWCWQIVAASIRGSKARCGCGLRWTDTANRAAWPLGRRQIAEVDDVASSATRRRRFDRHRRWTATGWRRWRRRCARWCTRHHCSAEHGFCGRCRRKSYLGFTAIAYSELTARRKVRLRIHVERAARRAGRLDHPLNDNAATSLRVKRHTRKKAMIATFSMCVDVGSVGNPITLPPFTLIST